MWARVKEFDSDDVDKNHAPDDGEKETVAQDAVDELNKNPVAENDTLDRLQKDHIAKNDEIDTMFYELQSGERMADETDC